MKEHTHTHEQDKYIMTDITNTYMTNKPNELMNEVTN